MSNTTLFSVSFVHDDNPKKPKLKNRIKWFIQKKIRESCGRIWGIDYYKLPTWFLRLTGSNYFSKIRTPAFGRTEKRLFKQNGIWLCESTFLPKDMSLLRSYNYDLREIIMANPVLKDLPEEANSSFICKTR